MKYDFAVIGGGPAGCIAARHAVKHGSVVLFEEHKKQPVQCAGLISRSGLEKLGIKPEDVLNEVNGAFLYSPTGTRVEIRAKNPKAYVLDRSEFDKQLLNEATDAGVIFINDFAEIDNNKKIIKTKNSGREYEAGRVILATGTNYNIHRTLNLDLPKKFWVGAQYELGVECDPEMVELHFVVPNFFAWVIPVDGYARVGICAFSNPTPLLDNFIKKLKKEGRIKNQKILARSFGTIPVYNPSIRTQYGNLVTVGDAAGQVKATTGGGVVMGGLAARFACEENYEKLWRSEIGRELYLHLLIRKFLDGISEKTTDKLFKIINENKEIVEEKGDMDAASKLVFPLMKNPKFMAWMLLLTPRIFMDLI